MGQLRKRFGSRYTRNAQIYRPTLARSKLRAQFYQYTLRRFVSLMYGVDQWKLVHLDAIVTELDAKYCVGRGKVLT
jgi:hypothetical protein